MSPSEAVSDRHPVYIYTVCTGVYGAPRELVLDYVIERKRMDDLASSIMDSRFREQKVHQSCIPFYKSKKSITFVRTSYDGCNYGHARYDWINVLLIRFS